MKSRVLVTGGAGYIGAHLVRFLKQQEHFVRVFDDLSSGVASRVENVCDELVLGTLLNVEDLMKATRDIDIIYHLAAHKSVEDSVHKPLDYYITNVNGTLNLLNAMVQNHVNALVFSSSSAVYGNPAEHSVFHESNVANPISPYGITKLVGELCIDSVAVANNISSISLRYFNVVGSSHFDILDQSSFNLFPKIVSSIRSSSPFEVRGFDYPTSDGTCIRDYIHVGDVINATYAAGEIVKKAEVHMKLNIGSGVGLSVLEILDSFKRIKDISLLIEKSNRRPGDPHTVIADISASMLTLNWRPKGNLDSIINSIFTSSTNESRVKGQTER